MNSPITRDAWARIRTWEPLREGILSPSPLTGLGYPRATREMPAPVKPFPWGSTRRRIGKAFFRPRRLPEGEKVAASAVPPDVLADFKFEGPYDAWMQLGKGERDFQGLVLGGKIRFRGSMPKIMALTGQLNRITQVAQQVPKEF